MENRIRKHFTQVPNEIINDPEISRDARFLFVYLCSKPDDWKFFNSKIEKDLKCSKDTRIKYFKELIETGWITVSQSKADSGEWGGNEISLNLSSAGNFDSSPCPKNTAAVKHGGGKTRTHNNTNLITNTNKQDIYIGKDENFDEKAFLEMWSRARLHYDKKPTNISKLGFNERSNFTQLLKDYSLKDFEYAIAGLFFQDTLPNVRVRPTHLLQVEYFETYLDCWKNKTKLFSKNKNKKNDNTGMI